jgi:hypothetical protein
VPDRQVEGWKMQEHDAMKTAKCCMRSQEDSEEGDGGHWSTWAAVRTDRRAEKFDVYITAE